MGEFQFREKPLSPDEIAKQYTESIRKQLSEHKKAGFDTHFDSIDPDELITEDLMMVDKLIKRELDEKSEEFKTYSKNLTAALQKYVQSHKSSDVDFDFRKYNDSRANLRAWIINKLTDQVLERKHPERPRNDIFANSTAYHKPVSNGDYFQEKRAA